MPTLEWIGKDEVISHHLDMPFKGDGLAANMATSSKSA